MNKNMKYIILGILAIMTATSARERDDDLSEEEDENNLRTPLRAVPGFAAPDNAGFRKTPGAPVKLRRINNDPINHNANGHQPIAQHVIRSLFGQQVN
jgi:hypothetical protein